MVQGDRDIPVNRKRPLGGGLHGSQPRSQWHSRRRCARCITNGQTWQLCTI